MDVQEPGAASVVLELRDGVITVTHGSHPGVVLSQWVARKGDWDRIWETLNRLNEVAAFA